jgi:hypothetical protein
VKGRGFGNDDIVFACCRIVVMLTSAVRASPFFGPTGIGNRGGCV